MIEVNQIRESLNERTQAYKDIVKAMFDKRVKEEFFHIGDLILRWDSRREDKGKHGKFHNLWCSSFHMAHILDTNTFILQDLEGKNITGGPVNSFLVSFKRRSESCC